MAMFETDSLSSPIVIDNGTGMIKAGFAGNERPRYIFNSYVGVPKHKRSMFAKQNVQSEDIYVGEEAQKLRGILKLNYPMKHGVINKIEDMTVLWEHVYHLISSNPSEHPVLLTEAPLNPAKNRNLMIETFFDKFHVPAVFVAEQAILALYGTGRTTGVVLDSGHGVTHCVPVYEGFSLPHAVTRMDVAGSEVTEHLNRILKKSGHNFHTSAEMQTVQEIKEKACKVGLKPKKHSSLAIDEGDGNYKYTLPDGKQIVIGRNTREGAPEVLFDPSLIGLEYSGIHHCVADAIAKSDLDLRRKLYSSIVLSGGSTMFKGFGDRLVAELGNITDSQVKIFAPVERTLSTWIGGSILSCLHTFKSMWITRKQYHDQGLNLRGL